jgi:outer membrane protein OmpA-like peptidoglycan-associated protein
MRLTSHSFVDASALTCPSLSLRMNTPRSTPPAAAAGEHDLGYYVMIVGLAVLACLLVRNHGSEWVVALSVAVATGLMGFAWLTFIRGKDSGRAGATLAFMGVVLAGLVAVFPPRSSDLRTNATSLTGAEIAPSPISTPQGEALTQSPPERVDDGSDPTQRVPAAQSQQAGVSDPSRAGSTFALEPLLGSEGIVVTFENTFNVLSTEVQGQMLTDLQTLAGILNKHTRYEVLLVGHTDPVETPDGGMALSIRRGEAVAALLTQMGVDRRRMRVTGRGSLEPVADVTTAEGRERNRRVEVALFP